VVVSCVVCTTPVLPRHLSSCEACCSASLPFGCGVKPGTFDCAWVRGCAHFALNELAEVVAIDHLPGEGVDDPDPVGGPVLRSASVARHIEDHALRWFGHRG